MPCLCIKFVGQTRQGMPCLYNHFKSYKMLTENIQSQKENLLHQLHHNGELLVLPNVWDPLGAMLLESLGYKAVATASASIAFSNGYNDGEKIPFGDLLFLLKKIVQSVKILVSADIESGYAKNNSVLKENIKKLFNPFFTTKEKGIGLVLSVSDRIIQDHNGYMIIDSIEGEGTQVDIYLPFKEEAGVIN